MARCIAKGNSNCRIPRTISWASLTVILDRGRPQSLNKDSIVLDLS